MHSKPVFIWIIISAVAAVVGYIWSRYDIGNGMAVSLYMLGWTSSLLAVGYHSTPSNSVFGKIAFVFVIIMVSGIMMKILHLLGANEIIIGGLLGIAVTYLVMWFGKKKNG